MSEQEQSIAPTDAELEEISEFRAEVKRESKIWGRILNLGSEVGDRLWKFESLSLEHTALVKSIVNPSNEEDASLTALIRAMCVKFTEARAAFEDFDKALNMVHKRVHEAVLADTKRALAIEARIKESKLSKIEKERELKKLYDAFGCQNEEDD